MSSARGAAGQGFKEIITRAVYGRGEGVAHGMVAFPNLGEVKKVLGATATEFRLGDVSLRVSGDEVMVLADGQFDVHVWYVSGEDTAVTKQAVSATVEIPVTAAGKEQFKDFSARVRVASQPQCGKAIVGESGGSLEIEVDATLAAEVLGETKLKVATTPPESESVTPMKPKSPSPVPTPVPEWDDDRPEGDEQDD